MADVYDQRTNKPRPDVIKQHFVGEGRLKPDVAIRIVADAALLLRQEKPLLEIPQPITGSVYATHLCFLFAFTSLEHSNVVRGFHFSSLQ